MYANDLLMDDDRYKWYLLQYLELNKNAYCSIDQLVDILDISRYKLEKNIRELKDELEKNQCEATIELFETGEIKVYKLTHAIVKKIRVHFLKRSVLYKIFHCYVTNEESLDKQSEELHLSRASIYRLYNRLKFQLKGERIELKKNQLIGNEEEIRNFLFGLYYELFNGLGSPFDWEIQYQAKELFQYLEHYFNLSLPKTKEHKLLFFMSIGLIRMRKNHPINKVYVEYEDTAATEYIIKWLDNHFSLTQTEKRKEVAALLLFCQMMEIDLRLNMMIVEGKEMNLPEELVDEFLAYLAAHSRFEIDRLKGDTELTTGLLRINRRWLIYHFRETTFVTKIQRRYFHEVNPKLDALIQGFIEKINQRGLFYSDQECNKLYYDYLFFLITRISVELLEEPVYICIDFSHGSSYNKYIQTMLSSLQSMNICYEEKLSNRTQIYLSDFIIDTLPCPQMIWNRPPTPEDWAEFGRLLLMVKGGSYE